MSGVARRAKTQATLECGPPEAFRRFDIHAYDTVCLPERMNVCRNDI